MIQAPDCRHEWLQPVPSKANGYDLLNNAQGEEA